MNLYHRSKFEETDFPPKQNTVAFKTIVQVWLNSYKFVRSSWTTSYNGFVFNTLKLFTLPANKYGQYWKIKRRYFADISRRNFGHTWISPLESYAWTNCRKFTCYFQKYRGMYNRVPPLDSWVFWLDLVSNLKRAHF